MKNYLITVSRQGIKLTTVPATAKTADEAITKAERTLNLNPQRVQMADNGTTKLVSWTGYEFCARQI